MKEILYRDVLFWLLTIKINEVAKLKGLENTQNRVKKILTEKIEKGSKNAHLIQFGLNLIYRV